MSEILWKTAEFDQMREHIIEGDRRFQAAMRVELAQMAGERGLRLIRTEPKAEMKGPPAPSIPAKTYDQERKEAIAQIIENTATTNFRWWGIVLEVCEKHGITPYDIKAHRRQPKLVAARREAMYRLRHETLMSYPAIGKKMGGFDHTSAILAVKKHQEVLDQLAKEALERG